ncbi:carbohydrate sulfotransferase 5-like isoform X2 [Pomacea canaliculata]|nr:carbohydrate sulfotransferase 5-like isoform X2 [Pomacea canaliculata]XP_025093038.1 carbohydrate sulfotransferase 5-like isoform X2 [Pomacea canaliculata]
MSRLHRRLWARTHSVVTTLLCAALAVALYVIWYKSSVMNTWMFKGIYSTWETRQEDVSVYTRLNTLEKILEEAKSWGREEMGEVASLLGAQQKTTKPRKVIIMSYPRSGSSLLGDIISHSHGVFYLFEPLLRLAENMSKPTRLRNRQYLFQRDDYQQAATFLLQALLNCSFSSVERQLPLQHLLLMSSTRSFAMCLKRARHTRSSTESCLRNAKAACETSDLLLLKVIRFSSTGLRTLLQQNPDLALLVLVRDLRASVWSHMRVFRYPTNDDVIPFASALCQRVQRDALEARTLWRDFPHRVHFLRYEELAERPQPLTRAIYSFLGLPFTRRVAKRVRQQTAAFRLINDSSADNGDFALDDVEKDEKDEAPLADWSQLEEPFSSDRLDSQVTASRWRELISKHVLRDVQASCGEVLQLLGYRHFSYLENVRLLNVSHKGDFKLLHGGDWDSADLAKMI